MWSESSLVIGYCFEAVTALPPVVVEFAREGEGTWGGGSNAGLFLAAQGGGRLVEDKDSGLFG